MKTRYAFKPGTIIRIPLEDGYHMYARQLDRAPFLAFFDHRTQTTDETPEQIASSPVLFVLSVIDELAIKDGRWTVVGSVPPEFARIKIPLQFKQSLYDNSDIQLIDAQGNERPATWEEARGLERAAVWYPEHVIDRIVSHYAQRQCETVEHLRLRLPDEPPQVP